MRFASLSASDVAALALDGVALPSLSATCCRCGRGRRASEGAWRRRGAARLLLAAPSARTATREPPREAYLDVREEARGLLLHALRREGQISTATADALNVLNQPEVVEKYTARGNRWTMSEASREAPSAVERARKELGAESAQSTKEWLRTLADALEAPPTDRPWYASTMVWFVLALAALFVLVHALLLARVLTKVHAADANVLLYPLYGLSASAAVGAFAIGVHKLSEPKEKQAKD